MTNGCPELLAGLTAEETERTLALGLHRSLLSGAELFQLGDPAECLFLIERGRIRLTMPMQLRGREEDVLVEERTAGQTVGWSALIPPYRFTLRATAPVETEVRALSREALRRHFVKYPAVGYAVSLNVAAVVGQRLQLFQAMWLRQTQRVVESLYA
jgi:CRP/FNR family transcriptional regulator, cyclic AMP receptor protein